MFDITHGFRYQDNDLVFWREEGTALDLYSHVTPEMQRLAADSLNGLLSKRKNPAQVQGEE